MQQRVAATVAEAGQVQLMDVAGHELVHNETDAEAVGAAGSQTVLPTVRFSSATSVEFTPAVNKERER